MPEEPKKSTKTKANSQTSLAESSEAAQSGLTTLPAQVRAVAELRKFFGHASDIAQRGDKRDAAKVLKGFVGAGVLERVEVDQNGTNLAFDFLASAMFTARALGMADTDMSAFAQAHCMKKLPPLLSVGLFHS